MKKYYRVVSILFLSFFVFIQGCSKGSAKDDFLSFVSQNEVEASLFSGEIKLISTNVSPEVEGVDLVNLVSGDEINLTVGYNGAFDKKNNHMEVDLSVSLKADSYGMEVDIPVIIKENELWVKIPNVPIVNLFFYKQYIGNFVKVNLNETADNMDNVGNPILSFEGLKIIDTLFNPLNAGDYFFEVEVSELENSADLGVEKAAKMVLTNENVTAGLTTIYEKAVPSVFELLKKDASIVESFGKSKADVLDWEGAFNNNFDKTMEEVRDFESSVNINRFEYLIGGNKKNIPVLTNLNVDVDLKSEEENTEPGKLVIELLNKMTNINKTPSFKYEIPSDSVLLSDAFGTAFSDLSN